MTKEIKVNGGELYKKTLDIVSPLVNEFIQKRVKLLGLEEDLESSLLVLPNKRNQKKIMRPTITYLIYLALGGKESIQEVLPALTVSELNNYYCYLDNWILDNKYDIGADLNKIKQVTIDSQMFRDLTQIVIEESSIQEDKKRKISRRLAKTTIKCYEGQSKDLQMTVDSLPKYPTDQNYLNVYLEKSRLQSGHLYGLSGEIGAILAKADDTQTEIARELCDTLGTGLHISGDLGDFTLFREQDGSFKLYQDQFADIINGRMTFPAYYALTHGNEQEKAIVRDLIGKKGATNEEKIAVSRVIISSKAYDETRKILNSYYNQFKRLVRQLPKSNFRDALSSVGGIITHNKYLSELKKFK